MASMIDPKIRKPTPPEKRPKQRISRQRRKTMDRTAEYNAMRDIYLEENPRCYMCHREATQVHHIVRGTAGRARSLRNTNAWLGLCQNCHEIIPRYSLQLQSLMKQDEVRETIERLMK
jgi:5-methylcytosine-specific restriction endonuclease McrA